MTNEQDSPCVVNITFKRIQEFLFAVPRLKAMIGANALLGETIRKDLVDLVVDNKNFINIKKCAGIDFNELKASSIFDNNADALKDKTTDPLDADNPIMLYEKGVITRDGGHFAAAFKDEAAAKEFISKARKKVSKNLPGVQIEARIRHFGGGNDATVPAENSFGESPVRLPQFQICQDTGSDIANQYKSGASPEYTSSRVALLEAKADEFKKGESKDIIGLLIRQDKLPVISTDTKIAKDLEELAGDSGYIAVIHADGNGIGVRRSAYAGSSDTGKEKNFEEYITNEIKNEKFFYGMRTSIRTSVINSLGEIFTNDVLSKHKAMPYHLLMLGGDDLLLIIQPQYAFAFIIEYSRQLNNDKYNGKVPYEKTDDCPFWPISIGAGIAIAHHKVPFYHLHHLAEELAGSAKKLYRSQALWERENSDKYYPTPDERSVVDWTVATTSWVDDIEDTRRLYDLNETGTHCITAKPYFVLDASGEGEDKDNFCLEILWEKAEQILAIFKADEAGKISDQAKLPRSQLKALLQSISRFKQEESETLYGKITPKPETLTGLFGGNEKEKARTLWQEFATTEGKKYLTQFKDFIELIELHYLGQQTKSATDSKTDKEEKGNG